MAKFNLNQLLMGGGSGTAAKPAESQDYKISHISVHELEPSLDNFYSVQQIEELKASIAAFGIKQNLIIAPTGTGTYRVIAGHRRRLAVLSLLADGHPELERVPCIVETGEDELRERLLLITTNSTTRVLTDWEKIRQVDELRAILEQIKKRDKIPGRLRDLIAQTLDTSPAQVGRMEAISKHLTPAFQQELQAERVNLSTAYEISGLDPARQQEVYQDYQNRGSVTIKDIKEIKQETPEPIPEAEAGEELDVPDQQPPEDELPGDSEGPEGYQMELQEFVPVEEVVPSIRVHELKTYPAYYGPVKSGIKPFEVSYNDRDYRVGDILHLQEYEDMDGYTGESCTKLVTYMLDDERYTKTGYVILGLTEYPPREG